VEWGKSQRQTSLIIDPPDGRMPALTPEGQARAAAAPRGTMGSAPLNGPEDFTMWERCISRGALGSTLPVLYNSIQPSAHPTDLLFFMNSAAVVS
jgi:hypothetical protein